MKEVFINTDFITLGQFLKLTNLVQSGGHVKIFINDNEVLVNNEREARRGRKLYNKDKIIINNNQYLIKKND